MTCHGRAILFDLLCTAALCRMVPVLHTHLCPMGGGGGAKAQRPRAGAHLDRLFEMLLQRLRRLLHLLMLRRVHQVPWVLHFALLRLRKRGDRKRARKRSLFGTGAWTRADKGNEGDDVRFSSFSETRHPSFVDLTDPFPRTVSAPPQMRYGGTPSQRATSALASRVFPNAPDGDIITNGDLTSAVSGVRNHQSGTNPEMATPCHLGGLHVAKRRSRSSAVMHVRPELEVLGSNPGGVGTQCPRL